MAFKAPRCRRRECEDLPKESLMGSCSKVRHWKPDVFAASGKVGQIREGSFLLLSEHKSEDLHFSALSGSFGQKRAVCFVYVLIRRTCRILCMQNSACPPDFFKEMVESEVLFFMEAVCPSGSGASGDQFHHLCVGHAVAGGPCAADDRRQCW